MTNPLDDAGKRVVVTGNVFPVGGFAGGLWTGRIDPSAPMPPQR